MGKGPTMNTINGQKYQQAILLFLRDCNNQHLGKTKLMKLLYYLDFDHVEKYGMPVTGDTYVCLKYGPVPQHAVEVLSMLAVEGLIRQETVHEFGYEQERYYLTDAGLAAINPAILGETEQDVLVSVTHRWRNATRAEIVEATHNEAPWGEARSIGDTISYESAHRRNSFGRGIVMDHPKITPDEQAAMLTSVISSQAYEGVHITRDVATRLLDEVMHEPLANIG